MKLLITCLLVIVSQIILWGCEKDTHFTGKNEAPVKDVVETLSGQEIFRAVYFYEGPIAELIPSIDTNYFNKIYRTFTEEEYLEFENYKADIISTIESLSNGFFDYFEQEMTSGDHYRVRNAMDRSMFEYNKALLAIKEYSDIIENIDPVDLRYENFLDHNGNFDNQKFLQRVEEEMGEEVLLNYAFVSNKGTCLILGIVVVVYVGAAIAVVVGVAAAIVVAGAAGTYLALAHQYASGSFSQQNERDELKSWQDDQLRIDMFIEELSIGLAR